MMPAQDMLGRLHETIAAVCPIDGISMVDPTTTPPTVQIHFSEDATPAEIDAAYFALGAFDWSEEAQAQWEEEKRTAVVGAVTVKATASDISTDQTGYLPVNDLTFDLLAGRQYVFEIKGTYTASAAVTGMQLALLGPPASFLVATFQVFTTQSSFLLAISNSYDVGVNPSSSGGATVLPFTITGHLTTLEAGPFTLRVRSERAGEMVTIKQGSYATLSALE